MSVSLPSLQMTGERPGKESEVPLTMRRLDRVVSAMGTPSVDVVLQLFPLMRHLPGWFRTQCRQAVHYRDRLVDTLFNHSKVRLVPTARRCVSD